jgi:hypothetical protein
MPAVVDEVQRPFGWLVALASTDPEAARGLASAYATLPPEDRRALVSAVVEDAGGEHVSAAPALLALLSVELDAGVANAIRAALGDEVVLRPSAERAGYLGEDLAALVEPLYGPFVAVFAVRVCAGGDLEWTHEPLLRHADADVLLRRLGGRACGSYERARTSIAELLWQHRSERGSLPSELRALAAVL